MYAPKSCILCPKLCKIDRSKVLGPCRGGVQVKIASAAPHFGEERCLSGRRGSGTVFFAGCGLGCVFCQNHEIRDSLVGRTISVEQLKDIFLALEQERVHNLNLVTPTHYRPWIQAALALSKESGFSLPVVWNTSGYETLASVIALREDVDIWLTDLKFCSSELSTVAANTPDYFAIAFAALQQMVRQTGLPVFGSKEETGILKRGVVVRMLVLPNYAEDAIQLLEEMAKADLTDKIILSLMRQYSPPFGLDLPSALNRRLHPEEYQRVVKAANSLGFASDYFQS